MGHRRVAALYTAGSDTLDGHNSRHDIGCGTSSDFHRVQDAFQIKTARHKP